MRSRVKSWVWRERCWNSSNSQGARLTIHMHVASSECCVIYLVNAQWALVEWVTTSEQVPVNHGA